MGSLVRSLWSQRRLVMDFVKRDLRARYIGSSMGFFWSVVFPILNLFIYMFVFRLVLSVRFGDNQSPSVTALLMLAGIMVWVAFAESLSRSTNALVENANLIQKVVFPSEVLPLYLVLSSLVNMLIGLPVVLVGVLWFGYIAPTPPEEAETPSAVITSHVSHVEVTALGEGLVVQVDPAEGQSSSFTGPLRLSTPDGVSVVYPKGVKAAAADPSSGPFWRRWMSNPVIEVPDRDLAIGPALLALPILMLLQGILSAGLGYMLAAFNLYLRDTYHLVGVGVTVWMFATPIFYPWQMVESAGFGWILSLNPMFWLINAYRDILIYGCLPDPMLVLRFGVVAFAALFFGSRFFMKHKQQFPDLL